MFVVVVVVELGFAVVEMMLVHSVCTDQDLLFHIMLIYLLFVFFFLTHICKAASVHVEQVEERVRAFSELFRKNKFFFLFFFDHLI